jgi:hypothetical protein
LPITEQEDKTFIGKMKSKTKVFDGKNYKFGGYSTKPNDQEMIDYYMDRGFKVRTTKTTVNNTDITCFWILRVVFY